MDQKPEKKKRSFSDRQLQSVLDGGYWSLPSPSRSKKAAVAPPVNTDIKPKKIKSKSPAAKQPPHPTEASIDINTTSSNIYSLPTSPDFYSTPRFHEPSFADSQNNNLSIASESSLTAIISSTTTTTTNTTNNAHPEPNLPTPPIIKQDPVSHSNVVQDNSIIIDNNVNAPVDNKNDPSPKIYQDPDINLDGSYWATFDPAQKRKKDRVLSDLTSSDSDYWNKRNARVAQRKAQPPAPPTDEQITKRLERSQQMKDENRKREQEEHERLTKKHEEAKVGKQIFPGIFLGSRHAAKNWDFFTSHQIKSVVNVTNEIPNFHENTNSVTYKKIPIADLPTVNFLEMFDEVATHIKELTRKGNVLIHCKEGRSRSPSLCMAYAMKHLNMTLADAHAAITSKSEIGLNIGFQQQLMSYERMIFNSEINSYNFLKKRNATPERDRLSISK